MHRIHQLIIRILVANSIALALLLGSLLHGSAASHAASTSLAARIVSPPDDTNRIVIPGNTRPDARAELDRGRVADSFVMNTMVLVLKRSPEQEIALDRFMEEQIDPHSPDFHHWLHPQELGELYGTSLADIETVSVWLQSHGFSVDPVNNARTRIRFTGTAGQVREAFGTEVHAYAVQDESHYANTADPSIPAALAPAVIGVAGLNDFPLQHSVGARPVRFESATRRWKYTDSASGIDPDYLPPTNTFEYLNEGVGPYDFATIYNVLPLWNAGITGAGQTIAIAGESDISLADVATFRAFFGLPVNAPVVIHNGADPGYTSNRSEQSADVEWSGAVARDATIKLVVTSAANGGPLASASYAIDNELAEVVSISYNQCELNLGTSENAQVNSIWQQAAAEGISAIVSAGDQASAGCDPYFPTMAKNGLQVNGLASTPYDTAVGGTDFDWTNLGPASDYWAATNSTHESNALRYIPEIPWNESCASAAVDEAYNFTKNGYSATGACEYEDKHDGSLLKVGGGSGGVSACTTPTGTTPSSCAGGYAKPSWQSGVGVPADGKRDLPDVALFAAGGTLRDAYIVCDSQTTPCDYKNNDIAAQAEGGTSLAAPAMAGVMALVLQKMGAKQGNAGPGLYKLAAMDDRAKCKSTTVAAGNICNFYDITTDTNAVPCVIGSPKCVAPSGDTSVGILSGYNSTVGYDLTTGLGSLNVANLVDNWHLVGTTEVPVAEITPTSVTFNATAVGSSSTKALTISNTGDAPLIGHPSFTGADATSFTLTAGTCEGSVAPGKSCTFNVVFKPAASGALSATLNFANNGAKLATVALSGTGTK
jgi:subtilase family serine protease